MSDFTYRLIMSLYLLGFLHLVIGFVIGYPPLMFFSVVVLAVLSAYVYFFVRS